MFADAFQRFRDRRPAPWGAGYTIGTTPSGNEVVVDRLLYETVRANRMQRILLIEQHEALFGSGREGDEVQGTGSATPLEPPGVQELHDQVRPEATEGL